MNGLSTGRPTDFDAFLMTKDALGVSEYQVFRRAYRAWYGYEPSPGQTDSLFRAYLLSSELPHFVRHFARRFLQNHPEVPRAIQERYHRSQRADHISLALIVVMVFGALAL